MNKLVTSFFLALAIFAIADAKRQPSNRCYEIIKKFEGVQLKAYK